jgi:SsrA-binding protein
MSDVVSNRRVFHDYEILETFEAGIVLLGTEIKSLRNHGGSLQDAYVDVRKDELWMINSSIAPYSFGNIHNHAERRERKLLMHLREIDYLRKAIQEKGLTLVPLSIYFKKGIAKVKIAIARGKKSYDKRFDLKKKEDVRAMERAVRNFQD